MKSFKTVGITGGIGTGKSLICRILHIMGYPVFYSDDQAKAILNSDKETIEKVKQLFGSDAYSGNSLNRQYISDLVFKNSKLLDAFNTIIHPLVRNAFDNWKTNQNSDLVFIEAAILFETGGYKNNDFNILITAPMSLRIDRIKKRDNSSEERIKARIAKQWDDKKKMPLADFIIINDESSMVLPQIIKIVNSLKK